MNDVKSLIKAPLIVAAVLVFGRLILEQAGAPESLNTIFGVAWLYLLVPFYFVSRIATSSEPKPYMALFKTLAVFAFITRLFVAPTYWLAYALSWSAPRFALDNGGVVGDGVTPLEAYLLYPFRNVIIWTVLATVIGMIFGGITLAVLKKRAPAASTP